MVCRGTYEPTTAEKPGIKAETQLLRRRGLAKPAVSLLVVLSQIPLLEVMERAQLTGLSRNSPSGSELYIRYDGALNHTAVVRVNYVAL